MGCSCAGGSRGGTSLEPEVQAAFDAIWPEGAPYPPQVPWVAVYASRDQAMYWMSRFPDDVKRVAASGNMAVVRQFAWTSLASTDVTVASERRKCCSGGGDGPSSPAGSTCSGTILSDMGACMDWVRANCTVTEGPTTGTSGVCTPMTDGRACGKCTSGVGTTQGSDPMSDF